MHDFTDFPLVIFMKFQHNNVDLWGSENFLNKILKILP